MIHVILGPPCAGKSTYCREHARDGDVVVDYDALADALGNRHPHEARGEVRDAAFAARASVIERALAGGGGDADHYVIHTSPSEGQLAAYEAAGADVVTLDPGMDECLRRAGEDGRPARTAQVIREWYERQKAGKMHRHKSFDVKADGASDLGEGIIEGYAATFDEDVPDSWGDVIKAGAFSRTLRERGERPIPFLFGHDVSQPESNLGAATAQEDEHGLKFTARLDLDNPKAAYTYKLYREGRISQFSFAYDVREQAEVTLDSGVKANQLIDLELFEISAVPIPANPNALVTDVKASKYGRRKSKADEGQLSRLRDALAGALEIVDQLIGDEGQAEGTEEGDEDGGGAQAQGAPDDDAKALDDVAAKYARFID